MKNKASSKIESTKTSTQLLILFGILFVAVVLFFFFPQIFGSSVTYSQTQQALKTTQPQVPVVADTLPSLVPLDKVAYDAKMLLLANNPPDPIIYNTIKTIEKNANGKSITTT